MKKIFGMRMEELKDVTVNKGHKFVEAADEYRAGRVPFEEIEFVLNCGEGHWTLGRVKPAGDDKLDVSIGSYDYSVVLNDNGFIEAGKAPREAMLLARAFIAINYNVANPEIKTVVMPFRKNVAFKAADPAFKIRSKARKAKAPVNTTRTVREYKDPKPNGKEAWKALKLVPAKAKRRAHWRHYASGQKVWIAENPAVTVYRKPSGDEPA